MLQTLEQAVTAANATVADSRARITKIETKIADANSRAAKAATDRQHFAFDASQGHPQASAEIIKARVAHASAEQDVLDLQHALSEAALRLVEAEREAQTSRTNLAQFELQILQRKRVDLAGEMDEAIAVFARLYAEYQELGSEIANVPDAIPQNRFGVTSHEAALGARRVRAAMPAFVQTLFPGSHHDEIQKMPLAMSEARHWSLPETATAKAA
jgi:chromosome segregation ATPase